MHSGKIKILVAEDDANLGSLLQDLLRSAGYQTTLCINGEIALKEFLAQKFQLCLLDVMMPKMDGFTLAKEIRLRDQSVPILFVTAKSMKDDKLKGYALGGDDYITKPFDEEELLWKLNAMVRRVSEKSPSIVSEPIQIGKYLFDCKNQALTLDGTVRRITEKESLVLNYLVQNKNSIVKREQMLKDIWGENDYFLGRSLDVFITKLRKYLKDDERISIESVFGVGFILNVKD